MLAQVCSYYIKVCKESDNQCFLSRSAPPLQNIQKKIKDDGNFFVFSQMFECHKKVIPFSSHKCIFVWTISFNIKTYPTKVNVVWTELLTVNNIFISNIAEQSQNVEI